MGFVVNEGLLVPSVVHCFVPLRVFTIFSCDPCTWGKFQGLQLCFRDPWCLCCKSLTTVSEIARVALFERCFWYILSTSLVGAWI